MRRQIQPVVATPSPHLSAGVWQPSVLRPLVQLSRELLHWADTGSAPAGSFPLPCAATDFTGFCPTARIMAAKGAGPIPASSTTVRPVKGPGAALVMLSTVAAPTGRSRAGEYARTQPVRPRHTRWSGQARRDRSFTEWSDARRATQRSRTASTSCADVARSSAAICPLSRKTLATLDSSVRWSSPAPAMPMTKVAGLPFQSMPFG